VAQIRFLSVQNVQRLHAQAIARFGGVDGLRDPGMLASAVAMPQASFGGEYLHPDLSAMAAAYLFHISQAHPFLDGNKRAAMAAALTLARLNGAGITATDDEMIEIGLAVAAGVMSKDELTRRMRAWIRARDA
jgi:death on curing protein